jgi:tyrosinase
VIAKSDYWKRIFKPDGKFDDKTLYGQLLARGYRFNEDL